MSRRANSTSRAGRPSLTSMAECPSGNEFWLNAASCIVSLTRQGPAARPGPGMPAMRG